MIFDPNPLFYDMVRIYKENYLQENIVIICNEGSSRSSKTWDFFHFLVLFCDHNRNTENEIYILRDTLVNCRDFTLKEYKNCLKAIGIWDESKHTTSPKPYYNLFGNHIYFRGLDDEDNMEGFPSDIVFINEALEIKTRSRIAGIRMRCRKLIVMDWNPKYTQHWCFDQEGQPNTFFTHSTYKNNKHLQKSVIQEIESYDPSNPVNVKNGTADDYRHKVYALGHRAAPEGLIFQYVNYVDEWPEDISPVYGLDFGFTVDPSALVKIGENKTDIFMELLLYHSTENPDMINEYAISKDIDIKLPCTADSSDKYTGENKGTVEMVKSLKHLGWNIKKVAKTKSIIFWINEMKKKRINIVRNPLVHHFRKEQENYRFKTVNGIKINQPIDGFDHAFSAGRYGYMSLNDIGLIPNKNFF